MHDDGEIITTELAVVGIAEATSRALLAASVLSAVHNSSWGAGAERAQFGTPPSLRCMAGAETNGLRSSVATVE